jgi:aldehyde:ferredoxin oxidoreductase
MIQNRQYVKESLILCDFAWPVLDDASAADHVGDPALESRLLSAVIGKEIDQKELSRIGERIFTLNRAILLRDGRRGSEDDVLPELFFEEREDRVSDGFGLKNPELLLPGAGDEVVSRKGKALDKDGFERMKNEYYELRDWDVATGLLKKDALEKIGLKEIIDPLQDKVI